MTSRERIKSVINRKEARRVATSLRCTDEAWFFLKEHFKVNSNIDVMDKLDIDMRWCPLLFKGPVERSAEYLFQEGTDFWGCRRKTAKNNYNTYYELCYHPLACFKSYKEIKEYDWPSLDWWDYSSLPDLIKEHKKTDDRAIVLYGGTVFEDGWYMRGLEAFLIDQYDNPEIVNEICTKIRDYLYGRTMLALEAADGEIDIIETGGDIGSQRGLILSPEIWRKNIKNHTAALITPFKKMGIGTFYHTCGSVEPLIEDFIEIGVDILDPIQINADNMEPDKLYAKYGTRISFHGAISEVDLLVKETPEKVYSETIKMIRILGASGGYIVSPDHRVQGDVSVENILAIYEAAKIYKY